MNDCLICTDNPNNFYLWKQLWKSNALYFKHHIRLFEWASKNRSDLEKVKFIILDRYTGNHDAIQTNLTRELRELGYSGIFILSSFKHQIGETVEGFDISIGSSPISRIELERNLCQGKVI